MNFLSGIRAIINFPARTKKSSKSFHIKTNLSEKQIEADVSNYFGGISNDVLGFRLLDVDEQITGADKLFDRAIPIYIQFKKSEGLKPLAQDEVINGKRSKLQSIREFRQYHQLDDNPIMYFKMRDLAKNAREFQHNILLKHSRPPLMHSIYVAPLELEKDKYYSSLRNSAIVNLGNFPFSFGHSYKILSRNWVTRLGDMVFLKNHISITPHERIVDSNHFYSYNQNGEDICWHSGKFLGPGIFRLSEFIKIISKSYASINDIPTIESIIDAIREIEPINTNGFETKLEALHNYGKELHKRHNIRQIVILFDSSKISKHFG